MKEKKNGFEAFDNPENQIKLLLGITYTIFLLGTAAGHLWVVFFILILLGIPGGLVLLQFKGSTGKDSRKH